MTNTKESSRFLFRFRWVWTGLKQQQFLSHAHKFLFGCFYFQFYFFKDQKRNDKTLHVAAHKSVIPQIRRCAFESGISSEITIDNLQR